MTARPITSGGPVVLLSNRFHFPIKSGRFELIFSQARAKAVPIGNTIFFDHFDLR